MNIDLKNLSPAPWEADESIVYRLRDGDDWCDGFSTEFATEDLNYVERPASVADAAFCALARNAFDVMMRRGWFAAMVRVNEDGQVLDMRTAASGVPFKVKWDVMVKLADRGGFPDFCASVYSYYGKRLTVLYDEPFTALVETDRWHKENVDAK